MVSVTREGRGNGAFELDAGDVVAGETDGLVECVLRVFFQSAPMTGEGFHGGVEVVCVDGEGRRRWRAVGLSRRL